MMLRLSQSYNYGQTRLDYNYSYSYLILVLDDTIDTVRYYTTRLSPALGLGDPGRPPRTSAL